MVHFDTAKSPRIQLDGQLEETLSMGIGQILFLQEQMCPILASIIHAASWLFLHTVRISSS